MFVKNFPEFDLGDYILREQQESDIADFFQYYSNPQVSKYILAEIPKNLEDAKYELLYWRNIFYNDEGIYFGIANKSTGKLIGTIGLTTHNKYNNRIELSYDLAQEFWRKGIMTKAINVIIKFTFETLRINRLEAITSTFNEPSILLLEKCGFKYEGCLRQHRYHLGKYVDVYSFSLLRQDYFELVAQNKI